MGRAGNYAGRVQGRRGKGCRSPGKADTQVFLSGQVDTGVVVGDFFFFFFFLRKPPTIGFMIGRNLF